METDSPKRSTRETLFIHRFPGELRSKLENTARDSERSLTAEILFRLRKSIKSDELAA
jgi:Arc-like DNA binding domain